MKLIRIAVQRQKYGDGQTNLHHTNVEIMAYIGLLIIFGAPKMNHFSRAHLWHKCRGLKVENVSCQRLFPNCLHFDKTTRHEQKTDQFASIRFYGFILKATWKTITILEDIVLLMRSFYLFEERTSFILFKYVISQKSAFFTYAHGLMCFCLLF